MSAIINGAQPGTAALEDYILSPAGQAVLASNGFTPPAPVPESPSALLLELGVVGLVALQRRRSAKP